MPGKKITDEDRQEIKSKFICSCCGLLLENPMQTSCGHLICKSCIEILFSNSHPKCPEDDTELFRDKIFHDGYTERELKSFKIHCSNSGCSWFSTYDQHEHHFRECKFRVVEPDNGEIGTLETIYGWKHYVMLPLQYAITLCSRLANSIPRPEFTAIVKKIRDGIAAILSFILLIWPLEKIEDLARRVEGLESIGGGNARNRSDTLEELESQVRASRTELNDVRKKNTNLEAESRNLSSKIDNLKSRVEEKEETVDWMSYNLLEALLLDNPNGILVWKIEGFQRKRQDAINGKKTALYSPPFYSARHAYKMCVKLYMNGDIFGKGTHLSLFFVVMRGDYDALQTWPFQKKIKMMLLDQGDGNHAIEVFNSDPQNSSFQRPRSVMNRAVGFPKFIPLDSLNNRKFIKDDTIFYKSCCVRPR